MESEGWVKVQVTEAGGLNQPNMNHPNALLHYSPGQNTDQIRAEQARSDQITPSHLHELCGKEHGSHFQACAIELDDVAVVQLGQGLRAREASKRAGFVTSCGTAARQFHRVSGSKDATWQMQARAKIGGQNLDFALQQSVSCGGVSVTVALRA